MRSQNLTPGPSPERRGEKRKESIGVRFKKY